MSTTTLPILGGPVSRASNVDAAALAARLRAELRGEVRFDNGSRGLYARDASNYRQIPIGVVIPRDEEDVERTVAACRDFNAPILARGGGTSLAGQCVNVAVVLDFSKYMNRILHIDPDAKEAHIQPGVVLDQLRKVAQEQYGLTFGPDPSTHNHCTLGGMIGNNSCGVHSIMAGCTANNLHELDILLYEGLRLRVGRTPLPELERIISGHDRRAEIYRKLLDLRDRYADLIRQRFPNIPRRVSGYRLDDLLSENDFDVARALAGSECTCVLVLSAKVRLVHYPPKRAMLVLGYPDVFSAGDHVTQVMRYQPIGLEGLDDLLMDYNRKEGHHLKSLKLMPEGKGWLLVEFGGDTQAEANDKAEAARAALQKQPNAPSTAIFEDPEHQQLIWEVRESGLGATAFVPGQPDSWEGWEDSAVPPERLGDYLRDLRKLFDKYGYHSSLYGHFGQGCVHCRINFDLLTEPGLRTYRAFLEEAAHLVVSYGGSISGEHGDGQSKAELLPIMYGEELIQAFREFKSIWDPRWKMNPGKVVDPYPITSNLALGTDYRPKQLQTRFFYPEDNGDFAHAALRCVGVGECRRHEGKTMCPSYRVTLEEKHTTRGRARLLFEMLQGDVIRDGWQSEEVRDALDLCLACKGCKGDCPVNVDMATYKAEFLSHYYEQHWRPRSAYAMGLIHWWARLASWMPRTTNFLARAPGVSRIVKWIGEIAPERQMPEFATETFKDWFRRRAPRNVGHQQVILWPDTFNNHFHPEVAKAAVEVLEHAGFHVLVPQMDLCCGRPLYDYGYLDLAKKMLYRILDALDPQIQAGVPLVGLEPSCLAVFRDELTNLLPRDQNAPRLKQQAFTLSEFLNKYAPDYQPPHLSRKAVVHGHCHHKAIMKMGAEQQLLDKMGLDYELLDSGCCGMAGSFGFEADHYEVSIACGERVLLPAVRDADPEDLIITDGFSCQEQILQTTNRRALHTAQVLRMALRADAEAPRTSYPEDRMPYRRKPQHQRVTFEHAALAGLGILALSGLFLWGLKHRNANGGGWHALETAQRSGRTHLRAGLRDGR